MSLSRLRAPAPGQILTVPPLAEVGAMIERNRRCFNLSMLGKSLDDLRTLARREVLDASTKYLADGWPHAPREETHPWLVAGHQPELFHPGVWFKNFALHQLAQRHAAMAINLIIDTDAAKPALLHAPSEGRLVRVPFDRSTAEVPYEERKVEDEATFARLPQQMAPIMSKWGFEPMLASFWSEVIQQADRTPLLGERFAAARRALESRWGVDQREVPMSQVCRTEAFAWFACAVLDELPAFHDRYNRTVQEYREAHGICSHSHPVPDLARDGDWREAPFWAWRAPGFPYGSGVRSDGRGRLFVRSTPSQWDLRVHGENWPSLPRDRGIDAWRNLEGKGYKVRSRALTTTMFARLFLADVFIHGIGGGIYDELTDTLIERHFAMAPPSFLVVSATLLLPLQRFGIDGQQVREAARHVRDLIYKPELFVERTPRSQPLIQKKQSWIARTGTTHEERVERFKRIRAINAELQPASQVEHARRRLAELQGKATWDEIAGRRDYAFCLYPEEMLREFFAATEK